MKAMTIEQMERGLVRARQKQAEAEAEEVAIYRDGGTESQATAARRRATQALWVQRKLAKQIADHRAAQATP